MKTQEFVDTDLVSSAPPTEGNGSNGNSKTQAQTSNSRAEIDARVEQARQQMLELRRQQEELERERQELEELRRREADFEAGKAEMVEELSRAVTSIEQEEFEIHKRSNQLGSFRQLFQDYVRQLQDIRENEWSRDELKGQLAKAVTVVEAARAEINKGRAQLDFLGGGVVQLPSDTTRAPAPILTAAPEAFDFAAEVKRGFARYLPLILIGVAALLIMLAKWK